jgi:hypothetical protein
LGEDEHVVAVRRDLREPCAQQLVQVVGRERVAFTE